ncbi:lipase/acyltransferase domain-containing protein [Priestia megaterium]|uniref:lipase/acyltransferase domain-containing protein n=1 Tax=Priestia megaterium TaxID=1404 RepID=UPI0025A3375C|nr:acyltransferase [Priestia megaterium]MDM8151655.1 acyltransferase [Priestia megaterium]
MYAKPNKQIIIIPGIMGSKLKEEALSIWIPHIKAIDKDLHIKLKYNKNKKNILSDGVLPLFYGRLKTCLEDYALYVDELDYDWRKDNFEHFKSLYNKIKPDVDEVILVAHSMGGLIAKAFLNHYSDINNFKEKEKKDINLEIVQKITKLITMGTPWGGAPAAYKALKHGAGIPYDKAPLIMTARKTKEIVHTFESVYQLLPNEQYYQNYDDNCKLPFIEYNGKMLSNWPDVYNEVYKSLLKRENFDFEREFARFQSLIARDIKVEHHEIIGYGKGTFCAFRKDQKGKTTAIFGDGDGTVPLTSAESSTNQKYYVRGAHQFLPNNSTVIDVVKCIIHGEDVKKTEDYLLYKKVIDKYSSTFNAKVIKVACPVLVSLSDSHNEILYGNMEYLLDDKDDNEVYNSEVDKDSIEVTYIDDTTYIIVPQEAGSEKNDIGPGKILIEAYDEGPTSISIEEYKKGKIEEINTFDSFIINKNKTAEFSLPKDSSKSELIIREDDDTKVKKPKTVKKVEIEELELPTTSYLVKSDERRIVEGKANTHIVGGNVSLILEDVNEGTHPVLDTYYSVNGSEFNLIFKGDEVNIQLDEGKNIIRIFSTDSAGNAEKSKDLTLYYIKNVIPKIVMKFYPKSYTLGYEQPQKEMYEELGIKPPKVTFEVSPKEGVNSENTKVLYRNKLRDIKIQYNNIFGAKEVIPSQINEEMIISVLGAEGSKEKLDQFLSLIGIEEPYKVRITKDGEKGTPKTIQTKYIRKAKEIIIDHEIFFVEIIRDSTHRVSFQNLSEDIKVDEMDEHVFKFKVLDDNTEITHLNLNAQIKMGFKSGAEYIDNLFTEFNENDNNYHIKLNIKDIKPILDQYWSRDSVSSIDLIIEENIKDKTKILRAQPITIR